MERIGFIFLDKGKEVRCYIWNDLNKGWKLGSKNFDYMLDKLLRSQLKELAECKNPEWRIKSKRKARQVLKLLGAMEL